MSAPLHALLYRSSATGPLTPVHLLPLLTRSMRWNAAHGVTGRLLVDDPAPRTFVQWIEGDPADVGVLFERIREDGRHTDLRVLASGPVSELAGRPGRLYPDWSMSLETQADLPASLSEFLAAYEAFPERRLAAGWSLAA